MCDLSARNLLLCMCTLSAFAVLGRAPGAVNLRLRDIETTIACDAKSGRDKKVAIRPHGANPVG